MFDMRCRENGVEHRFTVINLSWTNGQVERMNHTIKATTVKHHRYDGHDQSRRHLADFVGAYDFGRRLKTLKGLTPCEFICECWTSGPQRFDIDPLQQMPGLNTKVPVFPARSACLKIYNRINVARVRREDRYCKKLESSLRRLPASTTL